MSMPDYGKNKGSLPYNPSRGGRGESKDMRAISEQHLPDPRKRLDSKGSEKENIHKKSKPAVVVENSRTTQAEKVKRDIFGGKDKSRMGAWGKKLPDPENSQQAVEEKRGKQVEMKAADPAPTKSEEEKLATQLSDVSCTIFWQAVHNRQV